MARQSKQQKDTVGRVMHEFKHGELKTGRGKGPKVKSRKQAVAIALHEAGASNQESPRSNRRNLAKTKRKERSGQTGQARREGRKGARRKTAAPRSRSATRKSSSKAKTTPARTRKKSSGRRTAKSGR